MLSGEAEAAHDTLHWDCEFQWAVRSGPWKLSWVADNLDTQHLKAYEHAPMGNGWSLTNLTTDLAEQQNHITTEPPLATPPTNPPHHLAHRGRPPPTNSAPPTS